MKRVYKDRKGVGPLASSQEQGALLVLLINGDEPRVKRGFCSFIGLNRISLVCASGMFKRRVFDALESTSEACLVDGHFCLHPVLPDPAPPLRHAPRPDRPVVCPGFGLDKFPDMPCMKRV